MKGNSDQSDGHTKHGHHRPIKFEAMLHTAKEAVFEFEVVLGIFLFSLGILFEIYGYVNELRVVFMVRFIFDRIQVLLAFKFNRKGADICRNLNCRRTYPQKLLNLLLLYNITKRLLPITGMHTDFPLNIILRQIDFGIS